MRPLKRGGGGGGGGGGGVGTNGKAPEFVREIFFCVKIDKFLQPCRVFEFFRFIIVEENTFYLPQNGL